MVTDRAGNTAVSTLSISSMVPDTTPPSVMASQPANGSTVDLDIEMWVRFSEVLNWDGLVASLNKVGAGSDQVTIDIVLDPANLTVKFYLRENLEDSTLYRLTLRSIFDLRGNRAEDIIIEFRTVDKEKIDTDNDGIPDYFEVLHISFLSPSDHTDAAKDKDKDGLTNLEEYKAGTDLEDPDSDKDGMDDGWEVRYGLDPLSNSDAMKDLDGDGYSNLDEYKAGTDPTDRNDSPGSSGDDKVPLWMIILGIVVVVLLIGVIIGSVVIFSRRGGSDESGPLKGASEVTEPGSEAPSGTDIDECQECGAPLEESGICPVCGSASGPKAGFLNDDMSQPLDDETRTDPTLEDETEGPEASDEEGRPLEGGAEPPEEDDVI